MKETLMQYIGRDVEITNLLGSFVKGRVISIDDGCIAAELHNGKSTLVATEYIVNATIN